MADRPAHATRSLCQYTSEPALTVSDEPNGRRPALATADNKAVKLAERMQWIEVESAFDVLVRARAIEATGRSVIHLEIGEPDFPTPHHIIEAAKRALDEGWTHYGPTQGLPELREAIADCLSRSHKTEISPGNICVVPGGKPIIFFPMLALLEPGDEVMYPDPGFPIYRSMIRFLGAKPIPIPLTEDSGFSFDLNRVADLLTGRTKLLIVNSPQNPTGGITPERDLRQLAELVRDRDLLVLSDEIYSRLFYSSEAPFSIASVPGMLEKTIILDGFSKTYAMTGWRLGFGAMPGWLVDAVNKLMVNSNSCAATFTQRAAIEALKGTQDDVTRMISEFRRRRDYFCTGLNEIPGFRCLTSSGAFYAFPNVQGTGLTSRRLADLLLEEAGIATLDGSSFGKNGDGFLRFSYANSLQNLQEAIRRLKDFSSRWAR